MKRLIYPGSIASILFAVSACTLFPYDQQVSDTRAY